MHKAGYSRTRRSDRVREIGVVQQKVAQWIRKGRLQGRGEQDSKGQQNTAGLVQQKLANRDVIQ
jgi:hypothetical protein